MRNDTRLLRFPGGLRHEPAIDEWFDVRDVGALVDRLKENGVALVKDVHDTDWQTREIVLNDDQGHTLYFGQPLTLTT